MRSKAKGTRERIVETARVLFNEQGYGAVSTAALAAACGIAEGNLWYHFKTRGALLDALSERFAEAIEIRLALRPQNDPVGDYARLLEAIMAEFRDFRFLYRDQRNYGEHGAPIATRAPDWIERTYLQIEGHLSSLVAGGLLDWPGERLRDLAINSTIILRYGLDHYRELGEPTQSGTGAARRTLLRHLTLFEHRLNPAATQRLQAAIAAIEAEPLAA